MNLMLAFASSLNIAFAILFHYIFHCIFHGIWILLVPEFLFSSLQILLDVGRTRRWMQVLCDRCLSNDLLVNLMMRTSWSMKDDESSPARPASLVFPRVQEFQAKLGEFSLSGSVFRLPFIKMVL